MTKIVLLCLLTVTLLWDGVLYFLSAAQKKKPIPENVRDVYNEEEYARWAEYSAERKRLSTIEKAFEFVVLLVLYGTNVFSAVYAWLPGNEFAKSALLMLVYTAFLTLLSIPFEWVREMRIEEKYGFNRTTVKTFVSDQVKNFILVALLNVSLVEAALGSYRSFGGKFFIFLYAGIALFMILINTLSTTFMKLFNKFTPLEEGELRDILTKMFDDAGYKLSDIYVMDASTRTTKVNAFCSGMGKFKKIVLYDNLVNNYTTGEIAAVFAHELGHYKHRDTMKLMAYSLLNMAVMTGLIALFVLYEPISLDYGFAETNVAFAVIALMGVVLSPVMSLLAIPSNFMSRAFEYRADNTAVQAGYGPELVSSLKKLTKDNLSDLNPHPLIVALEHNHPTLSSRIASVEKEGKGA